MVEGLGNFGSGGIKQSKTLYIDITYFHNISTNITTIENYFKRENLESRLLIQLVEHLSCA